MKKRVLATCLTMALFLSACSLPEELVSPGASQESTEEATTEPTEAATTESNEEATTNSTEEAVAESADEAAAFQEPEYIEASFTPDNSYAAVTVDGFSDYSGLYYDTYGTPIPYCHLKLIKQTDGTYYCEVSEYRSFSDEFTGTMVSDGVIELKSDRLTGTVTITNNTASVDLVNENGEKTLEGREYQFWYCFPDLTTFLGTYTYEKKDGTPVKVTVALDEHREPYVTYEEGDNTLKIGHYPPYHSIFDMGSKLYASIEDGFYGPDDDYEDFIMGYSGNKYLIIDNSGANPLIYFKKLVPSA